ncbi:hypothetical protein Rsub_11593 [Raphidocelis subcapitata]|uniref:Uncharacterized protein n=1 Tax=Raphidocelis subcapitata TaxID=307507 RepID=A0A2V0PG50_9CHLO|nr:hypothetical protein Rsub_11593 [Raphidocelis subcapitata]|eukprot:GBF98828.1 hypothetical protein Rsub_11593 [Raphidocelis subcapitata]
MAATTPRFRAAALVLALAPLALAALGARADGPDEYPAFASNYPMGAQGLDTANSGAPRLNGGVQSFTGNPLYWLSDFFVPSQPRAGVKRTFQMYIVNQGDKVIPKGTMAYFWANKTEPAKCGEAGADAEYKLPELRPFQTYTLKVSVPYSSDLTIGALAWMAIFIDATCVAYNQSDVSNYMVVPATVLSKTTESVFPMVAMPIPTSFPYGWISELVYQQSPIVPVAGAPYTASIRVQNIGTGPLPSGVFMQVWPGFGNINTSSCTNTGGVTVELPKIGPGKIKTVKVEGLVAPKGKSSSYNIVLLDSTCTLGKAPVDYTGLGFYNIMDAPSAYIGGVQAKGQFTFTVKTTPKAPKANDTMTVKVKFQNQAETEGPIGKVALWLKPVAAWNAMQDGGWVEGAPCAYTGFDFSADFSGIVLKPGQSKTVKLAGVPVPTTPGWWQLSVVPDINCTLPASKGIFPSAPYASFEVVAP